MTTPLETSDALEQFSGTAPLFPLPHTVSFPNVLLPLHIFEPRYCRMTSDALSGERLIALALLKPGWERHYESKSPLVHDMVCLGRITAEHPLPDGRYNLLLQGLTRARIVQEVSSDLPYRVGSLQLCPDLCPVVPTIDREHRCRELLAAFSELFPQWDLNQLLSPTISHSAPLGTLCDVLTDALRIQASVAQLILDEPNVDLRSDLVLNLLRHWMRQSRAADIKHAEFPPQFSLN